MKRAKQTTSTVCRIVGTLHPAGNSKKTGKPYDEFVSFKIHDGSKVTDFRFKKGEDATDIIDAVKAGATTFDIEVKQVWRFEKDATHAYPMVIGAGYNPKASICYDMPEDDDLPFN